MSAEVTALHVVLSDASRSTSPARPYEPVAKVEPTIFEDVTLAEAAALSVFAAWTKTLPMAPRRVSDTIQAIDLQLHHVGRLASRIATRTLRWSEGRYVGLLTASAAPRPIESVDPWECTTHEELRRRTSHIVHCGSCGGRGQQKCRSCAGTSSVKCSNCNGIGKAYGTASNGSRRLMNCRTCNKAGRVMCHSCVTGLVACGPCNTSGKFERWIDFSESEQLVVRSEPDGVWTRAFQWGWDGTTPSDAQIEADARILGRVAATGRLSKEVAAKIAPPEWMDRSWSRVQPTSDRTQRVLSQELTLLEIPRVEVTYALPSSSSSLVTFEGRRMLVPPPSADNQFNARASKIRRARWMTFGATASIAVLYLLRGTYFHSGSVFALVMGLLAAAFAFEGYLRRSTLGRVSARRWMLASGIAVAAAAIFTFVAEPTLRQAQRYLANGQLEQAEAVLTALGNPKSPDRAAAWADLHLAEVLREKQPKKLAEIVATIPPAQPQYSRAAKHLYEVVRGVVEADVAAGRLKEARELLVEIGPVLKPVTDEPLRTDIAELKARVWDATHAACDDDICRWMAARVSDVFASNPERAGRLQRLRPHVMSALDARPELPTAGASRLERLGRLDQLAESISSGQPDGELESHVIALQDWVKSKRNEIPAVGSEQTVVAQLLHLAPTSEKPFMSGAMGKVAVHCNVQNERCTGLYIVTAARGAGIALNDSMHREDAARALSRAVGRETALPAPPKSAKGIQTTSWTVGKTLVTARWVDDDLVELRVGTVNL